MSHTREEIISVMANVPVATVATSSGDGIRTRMMHYASDEHFNFYLATIKSDPKTIQLTRHPSISLLVHQSGADITTSTEVEISGKALFVKNQKEREEALEMTAKRSPVVKYLVESGNAGQLDCIKVVPDTIKFRIFNEVTQGMPPTVIEFPENQRSESDWQLARKKVESWLTAIRTPFLTASAVPVLLGTAIAWFSSGAVDWVLFLLTLIAGLSVHVGANVINDYSDHKSGNDESNREFIRPFSGGSRVIQLGLLTPLEVLSGALLFFLLSAVIGLYLAFSRGPFILVLGVIGFASGMFYTGGPLNWAKRGIGEVVVGLNFGILMTLGAYYVQTQTFSWLPVIAAVPVSLLIAAVLYINEFPDYAADKKVGKKTLVVRLGKEHAVTLYILILAGIYLSIIAGTLLGALPATTLISLVTLPLAVRAVQYAKKHYSSPFDMVPANALTVTIHLATGLLLTLAFTWEVLGRQRMFYVALIGVAFLFFIIYMYRHIERQKDIFLGLKQAVR